MRRLKFCEFKMNSGGLRLIRAWILMLSFRTRTPFDVFVRASLNPTLVSVSPMFSPSQSLPVSATKFAPE